MRFADPHAFWLLLILIPLTIFYFLREKKGSGAVRFSDTSSLKDLPIPLTVRLRHLMFLLRCIAVILLTIALARPQHGSTYEEVTSEGVDIMLVMDVSTSMQALDFQPKNRLEVEKTRLKEFVAGREQDRIGLVLFAGRAFTKCPLTLDYDLLYRFIDGVDFGQMTEENATAIGTAIATGANRLREAKSKSKVMILATDGSNNSGDITPEIAAKAAGAVGIKIYTIGIGREGDVPYPVTMVDPFTGQTHTQIQNVPSDIDMKTLEKIAALTGGESFRAQNSEELKNIYAIIDKMEKSEVKTKQYTRWRELFYPWLIAGFALLLLEFILRQTRFRRIP